MTNKQIKVILKSGKDEAVRRFHPWVFSGAIKKIEGVVFEGDIVEVYSNNNEFLGIGHYQDGSIMVRILSFNDQKIDDKFWIDRISEAYALRLSLKLENTNVFRLINAEGDSLPGLIIDYFDGHLVIQCHSIGMFLSRDNILNSLQKVLKEKLKSVYDKSADNIVDKYPEQTNCYLYGASVNNIEVIENNNKFYIDREKGQKTGFFIDQRENRNLLSRYSQGKTVLNTFCYSGGFSVYALNAGAKSVVSVDSSAKAIELCNNNINLNSINNDLHKSVCEDTIEYLTNSNEEFDIIILDPPAYAKHVNARHNAVQGYKRLNTLAMNKIKKGGLLFTFSCSQVVNSQLFYNTIMSSAILSKRNVRVLHHLTQPADHPVNLFHPEGEYLKGLVLEIN